MTPSLLLFSSVGGKASIAQRLQIFSFAIITQEKIWSKLLNLKTIKKMLE
jgi:hypothetical protein